MRGDRRYAVRGKPKTERAAGGDNLKSTDRRDINSFYRDTKSISLLFDQIKLNRSVA